MELWSAEEKRLRKIAIENSNPDNPRLRKRLGVEEYQELKAAYDQAIREFENPRIIFGRRAEEAMQNLPTGRKYQSYLESQEWEFKRMDCLAYYRHRCGACYSKENLEVHHRTYERIFNEEPSDLIALCRDCHEKFHGIERTGEYY